MYLKSDGNGGFNISKSLILLGLILAVFTPIATLLVQGALMQSDINDLKTDFAEAGPRHSQIVDEIKNDIDTNENCIISIETKLDNIEASLLRIEENLN